VSPQFGRFLSAISVPAIWRLGGIDSTAVVCIAVDAVGLVLAVLLARLARKRSVASSAAVVAVVDGTFDAPDSGAKTL
jgi:hypothetical protein